MTQVNPKLMLAGVLPDTLNEALVLMTIEVSEYRNLTPNRLAGFHQALSSLILRHETHSNQSSAKKLELFESCKDVVSKLLFDKAYISQADVVFSSAVSKYHWRVTQVNAKTVTVSEIEASPHRYGEKVRPEPKSFKGARSYVRTIKGTDSKYILIDDEKYYLFNEWLYTTNDLGHRGAQALLMAMPALSDADRETARVTPMARIAQGDEYSVNWSLVLSHLMGEIARGSKTADFVQLSADYFYKAYIKALLSEYGYNYEGLK